MYLYSYLSHVIKNNLRDLYDFFEIFRCQSLNAALTNAWNEIRSALFEIYLAHGDFEVTRNLLLLTVIFTSGDIYRFLTSARWRAPLPRDRVLQAQLARVISAEFARGWKNGMNKNHAARWIRRRRCRDQTRTGPRTHLRAFESVFRDIRNSWTTSAAPPQGKLMFDVISRRTRRDFIHRWKRIWLGFSDKIAPERRGIISSGFNNRIKI